MKRLALVAALASLAGAPAVLAQSTPSDYVPPSTAAPMPAPSGSVPPMPSLDTNQSAEVQRQLAPYRTQIDARVTRGEITPDEAGRLLQWREWQIAQQVARTASRSAPVYDQAPPPDYDQGQSAGDQGPPSGAQPYQAQPYYGQQPYAQPYYAPYYGPYYAPPYYYAPRYYAPAPYYWGTRICAGGWGHHGGARVCF